MSKAKDAKSPKVKRSKIENDVERFRCEGNLSRAIELISQITDRGSNNYAGLFDLLNAELLLETIDKDCEPPQQQQQQGGGGGGRETPSLSSDRISQLNEANKNLASAGRGLGKDANYVLQIKILQGKLLYLQGNYKEALDNLSALQLTDVQLEPGPSALTKLIAEAFAIMGLSLEELCSTYENPTKATAKSQASSTPAIPTPQPTDQEAAQIIEYFELAGDLCIFHMQELEKGSATFSATNATTSIDPLAPGLPKVVETAIQRSPILHIQRGELNRAVNRFRQLLRFVETPSTQAIRQTLSRQFAEVLLRGVCSGNYQRYVVETDKRYESLPRTNTGRSPKHCRPSCYPSDRFVPEEHVQEAVLMLLISEFIANRSAILNRSPELAEARIRTLHNAAAVYDLLAIALVRKGCFHYLAKTLEHSLKFSYKEFHIWMQFALSLISAGKHHRAYLVLKECLRIEPRHIGCHIHAAVLAYQHLHLISDGLDWSEKLLDLCTSPPTTIITTSAATGGGGGGGGAAEVETTTANNTNHSSSSPNPQQSATVSLLTPNAFGPALRGRAHLLCGWGKSMMASQSRVLEQKRELQLDAVNQFTLATKYDTQDHLAWYHLALEKACQRNIDGAKSAVHNALLLCPSHVHSLQLLALLHTASGDWDKAGLVLEAASLDHPNHLGLLLLKAKVEAILHGNKRALSCYKHLLEIWRDHFGPEYDAGSFLDRLRTQYQRSPSGPLLPNNSMVGSPQGPGTAASSNAGMLVDMSDRASSVSGGGAGGGGGMGGGGAGGMASSQYTASSAPIFGCVDWNRMEQQSGTWLASVNVSHSSGDKNGLSITDDNASSTHNVRNNNCGGLTNSEPSPGCGYGRGPVAWQTKILLDLAALYLQMDSLDEALNCIEEAATVTRMCPAIVFMRGRYLEHVEHWHEARQRYEGVLSLCPTHVESGQRLARILMATGKLEMAEKILREAMGFDPSCYLTWQLLGEVLQCMGQTEAANQCLIVSLDLERTEPLEPFHHLPLGIGGSP